MKEIRWYKNDRCSYNGEKGTVVDTVYEWVNNKYTLITVSLILDCDEKTIIKTSPETLEDNIRFLNQIDGWNHGYSMSKIYGLSKEEFISKIKKIEGWENIFFNGQEEKDGSITFDVYRWLPDEVVDLFSNYSNAFVFANWHWDGDIFAATNTDILKCEFTSGPKDGDEEDWIIADLKITSNDGKYSFEFGAGDFTEDEILFYEQL